MPEHSGLERLETRAGHWQVACNAPRKATGASKQGMGFLDHQAHAYDFTIKPVRTWQWPSLSSESEIHNFSSTMLSQVPNRYFYISTQMYWNLPQSELLWVFIWKQGANHITILRDFKVFIGVLNTSSPWTRSWEDCLTTERMSQKKKKDEQSLITKEQLAKNKWAINYV